MQCTVWCSKRRTSHKYIWSYASPFTFCSSADYYGHLIPAPKGQKCQYYCSKTCMFHWVYITYLHFCMTLGNMTMNLQVESFTVLGGYALLTGSLLPMLRDNLSVLSDRLSQKSVINYQSVLCNIPEEQLSHSHHRRSMKLSNLQVPLRAENL
jgi:hypothetical protein